MEIKLILPFEVGITRGFWLLDNKVYEGVILGYEITYLSNREYQELHLRTDSGLNTKVATHLVFPTKQALLDSL